MTFSLIDGEKLKEEARRIYYAAPLLFPLLKEKKENANRRLIASFREGRTDNVALVAEIAVITEIERELMTKVQLYEAQGEINGNTK